MADGTNTDAWTVNFGGAVDKIETDSLKPMSWTVGNLSLVLVHVINSASDLMPCVVADGCADSGVAKEAHLSEKGTESSGSTIVDAKALGCTLDTEKSCHEWTGVLGMPAAEWSGSITFESFVAYTCCVVVITMFVVTMSGESGSMTGWSDSVVNG